MVVITSWQINVQKLSFTHFWPNQWIMSIGVKHDDSIRKYICHICIPKYSSIVSTIPVCCFKLSVNSKVIGLPHLKISKDGWMHQKDNIKKLALQSLGTWLYSVLKGYFSIPEWSYTYLILCRHHCKHEWRNCTRPVFTDQQPTTHYRIDKRWRHNWAEQCTVLRIFP